LSPRHSEACVYRDYSNDIRQCVMAYHLHSIGCMRHSTLIKKLAQIESKGLKLAIPYGPRRGTFKRANLEFNPLNGRGHSYDWYEITKVIRGKLVLNTFRYSVTTQKHVRLLQRLLDSLGLKYMSIEAPNGLQNLDTAASHHVVLLAEATVKNKYARIKTPKLIKQLEKSLALCISLGAKLEKRDSLKAHIAQCESERAERLMAQKLKRLANSIPLTNDDMRNNEANMLHSV